MTVSQAIGLCPALKLCEPDPVHYDEQFSRLVTALVTVSPVVEPVELGRGFVGTDGLEGLYGTPERIVAGINAAGRGALFPLPLGWGPGEIRSSGPAPR